MKTAFVQQEIDKTQEDFLMTSLTTSTLICSSLFMNTDFVQQELNSTQEDILMIQTAYLIHCP